jgi:hypothetical protein
VTGYTSWDQSFKEDPFEKGDPSEAKHQNQGFSVKMPSFKRAHISEAVSAKISESICTHQPFQLTGPCICHRLMKRVTVPDAR